MQWRQLYRIAAGFAILTLLIIPLQVVVFMVSPPPETVLEWFTLFNHNPIEGLISLDLIYLVNQAFMVPILLALFVALRKTYVSLASLGLGVGLFALAVHTTSNPSIDMLLLSREYASATTDIARTSLMASGELLVIQWTGTAYTFGYIVFAVSLLATAIAMWQSPEFGRWAAGSAIVMSITWLVPPTFGIIGLIFSLLAILPTILWLVLLTRHFFKKATSVSEVEA